MLLRAMPVSRILACHRRHFSSHSGGISVESLYKEAMRGLAAPVTVITTTHVNPETNVTEPRGLTLSSVTSLSVKPRPLISFNIQVPSRTSQVLHDTMEFAVNILPATKQSAEISRAFSGGLGARVNPFEREKSHLIVGRGGIPVVVGSVAVLYCKGLQVYPLQDHEIWVAAVIEVECEEKHELGNLLYQNQKFHQLGPEVD